MATAMQKKWNLAAFMGAAYRLPAHDCSTCRVIDGEQILKVASYDDLEHMEKVNNEYYGADMGAEDTYEDDGPRRAPQPVDPILKAREGEALAYIASYTGNFGLILDIRADRRFGTKYMSLSPKQTDAVLASKAREAQWAAERANTAQRPSAEVSRPVTRVTQDGFYMHDGQIVKVQVAVNGSGHLYAKRLMASPGTEASWEYAPGLVTRLTEDERLTQEQAVEFGRLYGVCGICGRTLTDETSIAAGIGPICSGRMGW